MNTTEYVLKSGDGLNIHAWALPAAEPVAAVLHVHGFGEHSGRYGHVAAHFVENNCTFISFDLRGHGKSGGERGYIPSYETLVRDIDLLYELADDLCPSIPRILYGHSLGGNLALNHYFLSARKPDAMICTSPWLRLAFDPPALLSMIGNILRKVHAGLVITSPMNPQHLSRDPRVPEQYISDPLVHKKICLRLAHGTGQTGEALIQKANGINIPLLIMLGTNDRIISCQASREMAANNPRIELKNWEGYYHELHNEPEKDQVLSFMTRWISSTLKQ